MKATHFQSKEVKHVDPSDPKSEYHTLDKRLWIFTKDEQQDVPIATLSIYKHNLNVEFESKVIKTQADVEAYTVDLRPRS